MEKELVRLERLTYYGDVNSQLSMGNLTIRENEVMGLLGLRDSGHIELVEILIGLKERKSGNVFFGEKQVQDYSTDKINRLGIYYLNNNTILNNNLTVAENIFVTNKKENTPFFIKYKDINHKARMLTKQINMDISPTIKARELTIAQHHLIVIAKALYEDSKLIILDNLIAQYSEKDIIFLKDTIQFLKSRGISVLCKFNNFNELIDVTDRLTIMRNGFTVKVYEKKEYSREKIMHHMVGYSVKSLNYNMNPRNENELLRVEGLYTKSGLKDINFSIKPGEVIIMTDNEGEGGIEIANILSGNDTSAYLKGDIYLNDQKIKILSINDAIKKGIGFIPESGDNQNIFNNLNTKENISIAILPRITNRAGFVNKRIQNYLYKEFEEEEFKENGIHLNSQINNLDEKARYAVLFKKWSLINPKILIIKGPSICNDELTREYIVKKIDMLSMRGISIIIINNNYRDFIQCKTIVLRK